MLAAQFKDTQARIGVETGALKVSGRARSLIAGMSDRTGLKVHGGKGVSL